LIKSFLVSDMISSLWRFYGSVALNALCLARVTSKARALAMRAQMTDSRENSMGKGNTRWHAIHP
jgi:hypothetical protein